MPSFSIDIHGCPKAVYDSEIIATKLFEHDFDFKEEDEKRDYTIIFTCGFLKASREESDEAIRKALSNPEKNGKVVVVGCYSQIYFNELKKKFPDVYLFTGVNEFQKLPEILRKRENLISKNYEKEFEFTGKTILTGQYWDYLKISEGCSHKCSFCIIPKIRGKFRSRDFDSIKVELEMLESIGIEEINIISQDSSYYGIDKGDQQLVKLLDLIENNYDFHWIRVLYLNPMHINDEIIERIGQGRVLPYFDIPFQHSSEKILKYMKRAGDKRAYMKIIERIRKTHPEAFIRTSLITGFPGEGEKEFEELVDFVKDAEFDHLGVFVYSDEPLSSSYILNNKVPKNIAEERSEIIYEIQNDIFHKKLKKLKEREFESIYEYEDDDFIYSRFWFQAPEGIDSFSYIEKRDDLRVKQSFFKAKINKFDFELNGFEVKYLP